MKAALACGIALVCAVCFCAGSLVTAEGEHYPGTDMSVPESAQVFDDDHSLMRHALFETPDDPPMEKGWSSTQESIVRSMHETIAFDPGNRWALLKVWHPWLSPLLEFFNPPQLRNFFGDLATFLLAFASLAVIVSIETEFKFLFWCAAVFCWGRIISYMLLFLLTWKQ